MTDRIRLVLGGVLAMVFGLSALSRRLPHVVWLRPFGRMRPRLSEGQRAEARRRGDVDAGAHLILLGLALPLFYVATTVMLFSAFTARGVVLTLAGSVTLIGLGAAAIRHGRRSSPPPPGAE